MKTSGNDIKQFNKSRIVKYISKQASTSKLEIANNLGISMPTVFQNIKELIEIGIVEEIGAYQSTGGRKAKALSLIADKAYAVGVDITSNHINFVIVNLSGRVIHQNRVREGYDNTLEYYHKVNEHLEQFIMESNIDTKKILGVGVSIPGIIDRNQDILIKSHILQVSNVNLQVIRNMVKYPIHFENDANSAALAELHDSEEDAVYLSLSNSVGGAICMGQKLYRGKNFRSAELGHMIIQPNGKECYCGKLGCVDSYCSAKALTQYTEEDDLEYFFTKVQEHDGECSVAWETYLKYLAMTVTNIRMMFDCDIILGGYVGGYMENYMLTLNKYMLEYNKFDNNMLYLKSCKLTRSASAIGIAMSFVDDYLDTI